MSTSNRDLLEKMTAVGGKRYSPYSSILSFEEWTTHFGTDVWKRFAGGQAEVRSEHSAVAHRRRYSPDAERYGAPRATCFWSERFAEGVHSCGE